MLTTSDIRTMHRDGETPMDILIAAVQSGIEYPDAVWLIARVLHLDQEGVDEMEADYAECI